LYWDVCRISRKTAHLNVKRDDVIALAHNREFVAFGHAHLSIYIRNDRANVELRHVAIAHITEVHLPTPRRAQLQDIIRLSHYRLIKRPLSLAWHDFPGWKASLIIWYILNARAVCRISNRWKSHARCSDHPREWIMKRDQNLRPIFHFVSEMAWYMFLPSCKIQEDIVYKDFKIKLKFLFYRKLLVCFFQSRIFIITNLLFSIQMYKMISYNIHDKWTNMINENICNMNVQWKKWK